MIFIGKYPDDKDYDLEYMSEGDHKKFLEWKEVRGEIFDFQKEMYKYCSEDVNILRKATIRFRQHIIEMTGDEVDITEGDNVQKFTNYVDPFDYSTIASVCMKIYRTCFYPENWEGQITDDNGVTEKYDLIKKKGVFYIDGKPIDDSKFNKLVFVKSPIAYLPRDTYNDIDQYSLRSIQWLALMEKKLRLLSGGGALHMGKELVL